MGERSKIAWTDHTFNPWWGCTKISAGCKHCYAEAFAKRFGVRWGHDCQRRLFGEKHWLEPLKWNFRASKTGVRERVFSGSMCDVFEEDRPRPAAVELAHLIGATPYLDWLLLTKRPHVAAICRDFHRPNVWMGTTVEDQAALGRISALRRISVPVHFLSCEPLLEDLGELDLSGFNWVIVGCESGPGARPMHLDWVRRLRDQAQEAEACFFFKQAMVDGKLVKEPELDGRQWLEMPWGCP
jgi:protein gp37